MPAIIRRSLPVLLLPLLGLFASCSEDFTVGAPYRPITVVYGLMDIGDTAHYIRIQKAFYDEGNSLAFVSSKDSNFYDPLEVHLKEVSDTTASATVFADETLQRVDLNNENYQKDSGVFFSSPSFAYKTKRLLNADRYYRLVIYNPKTGEKDSGVTPVISDNNDKFFLSKLYNPNNSYELAFLLPSASSPFDLTLIVPANSRYFDAYVRFHYGVKSGGVETKDSVDYKIVSSLVRQSDAAAVTLSVPARSFFGFLGSAIPAAPAGTTRYLDSASIIVWAGSNDLYTYQLINGAQGGLTADQIKILYTNMRGANAYGLFSTRAKRTYRHIPIEARTLDSVIRGLPQLGFKAR